MIPYSRLVEYAWGYYDEDNSSLLKTHICHIRKKLGLATSRGSAGAIKAVLGVGYTLSMGPASARAPRPIWYSSPLRPALRYHLLHLTA